MSEEKRAAKAAYTAKWREANRGYNAAYSREWRKKNKTYGREYNLKKKYNLSPEEYDAMLASQDGHCAMCPATEADERYGRLNVDHCHNSNDVRGLLCSKCNRGIGLLGDTAERLRAGADYLERAECKTKNSTKPTSAMAGQSKRSPPIEPNESRHTNWSAGLL